MATLPGRPRSALLVVDVQHGAIDGAPRRAEVVANIAALVSDARTTEDLTAYGAPPPEQVIARTHLCWTDREAPGRTAGTVAAADVAF
ncbi:MAG TPA: hypothetical protein VKV21_11210 [Solirubrobacteraceae bacterium]|nr:hypothetical protein [Solirubrobacteraceae bacterium]